jgi:probable phosphoglycerate mutase
MDTGSTASTLIALVRHGQSEGNVSGCIGGHCATPLTELGHRQSRATAEALVRELEPTVLVSSDLVRARQTAEPIARSCALDLGLDARLRERSLGVMDGLSFTDAAERYPDDWQRLRAREPGACPPGGETVAAVFERVSQVIDHIAHSHLGERVVVVSHGLAIYHAFAHICGLGSPARGLRVFSLVDNCSISLFTFRRDHWLLGSINDRAHLRDLT